MEVLMEFCLLYLWILLITTRSKINPYETLQNIIHSNSQFYFKIGLINIPVNIL